MPGPEHGVEEEVELVRVRTLDERNREGFLNAIDVDAAEGDGVVVKTEAAPAARKRDRPDDDGLVEFMHGKRLFCAFRAGAPSDALNSDVGRYVSDIKGTRLETLIDLWYGPLDASARREAAQRCLQAGMSKTRFDRVWSFGRKIAAVDVPRGHFERFLRRGEGDEASRNPCV